MKPKKYISNITAMQYTDEASARAIVEWLEGLNLCATYGDGILSIADPSGFIRKKVNIDHYVITDGHRLTVILNRRYFHSFYKEEMIENIEYECDRCGEPDTAPKGEKGHTDMSNAPYCRDCKHLYGRDFTRGISCKAKTQ